MWVLVLLALLRDRERWPPDIMRFSFWKLEFKGWITDYTRSSLQGMTHDEVVVLIVDLQKMVPGELNPKIDWDQSKKVQGNGPTKIIVNMCFKNRTTLAKMIGLLKVVKEELKKVSCTRHGQEATARLEMSLQKKPLAKAHALFYKGLKAMGGDACVR